MEENKKIKQKWLHVRLDDEEFAQLHKQFSTTTEGKISRYARKILLAQPVTVVHRNGSLDELIQVLTRLQNDLNGVANNYNQMVHKLHTCDTIPQIRAWIEVYEKRQNILFDQIAEIKTVITKTAHQWLR